MKAIKFLFLSAALCLTACSSTKSSENASAEDSVEVNTAVEPQVPADLITINPKEAEYAVEDIVNVITNIYTDFYHASDEELISKYCTKDYQARYAKEQAENGPTDYSIWTGMPRLEASAEDIKVFIESADMVNGNFGSSSIILTEAGEKTNLFITIAYVNGDFLVDDISIEEE